MIQHVLRVKSPTDQAREAYFDGKISTGQYLRQALGTGAAFQADAPRAIGIRHCLFRAVRL